MSEQYENNSEDEISLIDLFAVLIRYRKLIIAGTLAVAIAALAWLFVLPRFVFSSDSGKQVITYNVKTENLPLSLSLVVGYDVPASALFYMQDAGIVAEVQKEFSLIADEKSFSSEAMYNLAVKQAFDSGTFSVEESNIPGHIVVSCTTSNAPEKSEAMKNFMLKFLETVSGRIEKELMPEIDSLEKNVDSYLKNYGNAVASKTKGNGAQNGRSEILASVTYADISYDAKSFKAEFKEFVSLDGNGFSVPVSSKRTMKFIISVFAAFFIFTFIAFFLNCIENIKRDDDAVSLIKKAWNEGR